MEFRLLLDADVPKAFATALRRRVPAIDVRRVQEIGLRNASDEEILRFAAKDRRIVVSRDKATLRVLAAERVRLDQPMPGLFVVPDREETRWSQPAHPRLSRARNCQFDQAALSGTCARQSVEDFPPTGAATIITPGEPLPIRHPPRDARGSSKAAARLRESPRPRPVRRMRLAARPEPASVQAGSYAGASSRSCVA